MTTRFEYKTVVGETEVNAMAATGWAVHCVQYGDGFAQYLMERAICDDIEVGDVVTLRGGGTQMTAVEIKDGRAECAWFDEAQNLRYMRGSVSILKKFANDS